MRVTKRPRAWRRSSRAHPDVELAEPDHVVHVPEQSLPRLVEPTIVEPTLAAKLMPNDPLSQYQSYLDDSPGGINTFAAWDITTGSI